MKMLFVIVAALMGFAQASTADFLSGKIYKSATCAGCEVKFRSSNGKMVADLTHWGWPGQTTINNRVEVDVHSSMAYITVTSNRCAYYIQDQTRLMHQASNADMCPKNLSFSRNDIPVSIHLDGVFSASNCPTCEVKFRTFGGKIVADMINWGESGQVYALNNAVEVDSEAAMAYIKVGSSRCEYYILDRYTLLHNIYNGGDCPDRIRVK